MDHMAVPVINVHTLFEQMDSYTPCLMSLVPSTKEEGNRLRLLFLISEIVKVSCKKFSVEQTLKIVEAMVFAAARHKGVRRADKLTPYLLHVLEVLYILIGYRVNDYKIFVATIIHDVVEDTETKLKEIRKRFGYAISRIVDLLTKHPNFILRMGYWWMIRTERDPTIRWRVIVIKFADRIHNLMTLTSIKDEGKRRAKIQETEEEFPRLYQTLVKTLKSLETGLQQPTLANLPFHLNNRLYYELSHYT
jgi:guanosine-3',5'-bis(diphosphate) 3'-pyrophosphohydrolase